MLRILVCSLNISALFPFLKIAVMFAVGMIPFGDTVLFHRSACFVASSVSKTDVDTRQVSVLQLVCNTR